MEKEPSTKHIWFPNVEQLYYIQLTKLYVKSFSLQITLTSKGAFELEKSQYKLNFPIRCKCLYTQKTENNILANVLISWGKKLPYFTELGVYYNCHVLINSCVTAALSLYYAILH